MSIGAAVCSEKVPLERAIARADELMLDHKLAQRAGEKLDIGSRIADLN